MNKDRLAEPAVADEDETHSYTTAEQSDDRKFVREYIERARRHHEETGEWLPDPLLDEVAEMRRRIMARHDNDYRKVLRWYVELGRQHARNGGQPRVEEQDQSTGVSGR